MIGTIRKNLMVVMIMLATMVSLVLVIAQVARAEDITPSTSLTGSGNEADPFLIATAADLAYMRDRVIANEGMITPRGGGTSVEAKTAHYKLTADIVLGYWQDEDKDGIVDDGEIYNTTSGGVAYVKSNWIPIGEVGSGNNWQGTFDGNGHIVSGIYINTSSDDQGLFGVVENGTIKNLGVKDSYIKGGWNVGGIAGSSSGTIQNCYNTGSVSGNIRIGGIAGGNWGTVQYCYNTGSVSCAERDAGGIAGNNGGTIRNCSNVGSVGGKDYIGGIAGATSPGSSDQTIQNCYNIGSISGRYSVGGIAGYNGERSIQNCYNAGSVIGINDVGGVLGENYSETVTGCYYDRQMCPVGGIGGEDSAGSAEGKLTSEMASGAAFDGWSSGETGIWNFTAGLYPRLTGYVDENTDYKMDVTDEALVFASPVILAAADTPAEVKNDFTLGTAKDVAWISSNESVISINNNSATLKDDGTATLTAYLEGIEKSIQLRVERNAPMLKSAVCNSDTQITVTLSEPCVNLTNSNDSGFTVKKTGTTDTFAVTATAQGADTNQIILTVDDTMAIAAVKGITVTYTAGGNGQIADIAGNLMETDNNGVTVAPWAPKLSTPGSLAWDGTIPAKATWGEVENASSYAVQLYKNNIASDSPVTGINDTFYDFTAAITAAGSYTFTVQAIGNGETYADSEMSSRSPEYTVLPPTIGPATNTPRPPEKTITVTETSSDLFEGVLSPILVEANMEKAFSSSVEVRVTDTQEDAASFGLSAGDEVYPFDISLYIKGTNGKTKPAPGYTVKISLPVPEGLLDVKEQLAVMHKSDSGIVTEIPSRLLQKDGVWYIVFEAAEFSPYALVVRNAGSNGKSFTDIAGHWAASYISFVTEREIFVGTGDGIFSPDTGMTRAMFATAIGRLYERLYVEIKTSGTQTFTDCDYDAYYGKYVDWASENGIIGGYGNGRFGPDDLVTREQMATILYRFTDFIGVVPDSMDTVLDYPDAGSISDYAKAAAIYCQTARIIEGRDGGVFAPKEAATRAEVAAIIQRFVEAVPD